MYNKEQQQKKVWKMKFKSLPSKFPKFIPYKSIPLVFDFNRGTHVAQNTESFASPFI